MLQRAHFVHLNAIIPILERQSLVEQNRHLLIDLLLNYLDSRTNHINHFLDGALPLNVVQSLHSDAHRRINIGFTIEEALILAIVMIGIVAWVQVLLFAPRLVQVHRLLNRVLLKHGGRLGESVAQLEQQGARDRQKLYLVLREFRCSFTLPCEDLRVVAIVLDQDHLLLAVHLERVFAHGEELEVELLLHDDLIEINHGAFAINQDRFAKARGFADCNTASLHKVHFFALKHGALDRLPMCVAIESKHDNDVVDKLRLTAFKEITEVVQKVAE